MEDYATQSLELARINNEIEKAERRLAFVNQKITEGEAAYDRRAEELHTSILGLEKRVRQLGEQAREYELGMKTTREEDAQRTVELDKQEADLKGRERRLGQGVADFEHRQRRIKQLKDMQ